MKKSSFEVGDLVQLRQPCGLDLNDYHIGIVLRTPSIFSKSKMLEILWLTKDGKSVTVMGEGRNLKLLSAHEGNEMRYAKYRKKDE